MAYMPGSAESKGSPKSFELSAEEKVYRDVRMFERGAWIDRLSDLVALALKEAEQSGLTVLFTGDKNRPIEARDGWSYKQANDGTWTIQNFDDAPKT
jgi:hypothetical protein